MSVVFGREATSTDYYFRLSIIPVSSLSACDDNNYNKC